MVDELIVYTDHLGKFLWEDDKLLEARRTSDAEEGFIYPITISKENIVWEFDGDILDVKRIAPESSNI